MPAVYDQTSVDIEAKADRSYDFRVTGSVLKFDGFLRVYEEAKDTKDEEDDELKNTLPALTDGQKLRLNSTLPEQHFTEPPPRYNEASLVKVLEERGIGRPSTYSSIITTIQDRKYVTKVPPTGRAGRFFPTEIGLVVTDLLVANFPLYFRHAVHRAPRRRTRRNRRRHRKVDRSAAAASTATLKKSFSTPRSTWKT